ncbi:MAG TPA: LuxR C-terminal-related transcriptional regulator [Devosia sp.]|nr:LuxR C-terminal-related transcriptional regulator [Devosia sp.]
MRFVEQTQALDDIGEVQQLFSEVVSGYRLDYCLMLDLGPLGLPARPTVFQQSYPDAWTAKLGARGGEVRCQPLLDWCWAHTRPAAWHDISKHLGRSRRKAGFERLLQQLSVVDGFVCPVHSPSRRGAVLLSASRPIALSNTEMVELTLAATVAHRTLFELHVRRRSPRNPLTQRQLDALRWAAAGKSYWDIGQILGISEQTVKSQLATTRQRLRANTTTQAAAIAIALNYFTLADLGHHT